MMVESKAVALVTVLMVWQRIESPPSWTMKKKSAIYNEIKCSDYDRHAMINCILIMLI